MDKDILKSGNTVYCPEFARFVPQEINSLFLTCNAARGEFPVGVSFVKSRGKFLAQCKIGNGKLKFLGLYDTPEEAFTAYRDFKEKRIKSLARKYHGKIDDCMYDAMMEFEVVPFP